MAKVKAAADPYAVFNEDQIQAALFLAYAKRGIGGSVMLFAIPNGRKRDVITATLLKREGVKKGAIDMIAVVEGAVYFIEIKTLAGERRKKQIEFHRDLTAAGGHVYTLYGYMEAVTFLEDIGVLRRPVIRGDHVQPIAV